MSKLMREAGEDIRDRLPGEGQRIKSLEVKLERKESENARLRSRVDRAETEIIGLNKQAAQTKAALEALREEVASLRKGLTSGGRDERAALVSLSSPDDLSGGDYRVASRLAPIRNKSRYDSEEEGPLVESSSLSSDRSISVGSVLTERLPYLASPFARGGDAPHPFDHARYLGRGGLGRGGLGRVGLGHGDGIGRGGGLGPTAGRDSRQS